MMKRIKPVSRIIRIETRITRIQGKSAFQKRELLSWNERWAPLVDVYEKEDEIVVEAEIPGINEKDVTVTVHSNCLEVKGIKRETAVPESTKYLRLEREYGGFRQIVILPSSVRPDEAKAVLENGILSIVLKKMAKTVRAKAGGV